MPNNQSQEQHDALIEAVAVMMKHHGFRDIRADLDGFEPPARIGWRTLPDGGHMPDATGFSKGDLNIFEVETHESIDDTHTERQWIAVADEGRQTRVVFWVVVPRMARQKVEQKLKHLRITAHILSV